MLRPLIRFSVHHAKVMIAIAATLMAYAGFLLSHAGLDIFPEFSGPRVVIQTEAYGLTPEQTETAITQKVEKALLGLIGLEELRSESIQGLSIVTAIFEEGTDIYRNRQLVSERLQSLANEFPMGTAAPIMVPLSSSSATLMTLGLKSSTKDLMQLRDLVDWTIAPRLLSIPGVADVNVYGGETRQLQIQPNLEKLRQYGLSLQDILQAAEEATGMPGSGFLENASQRISLTIGGLPDTPEMFMGIVVKRLEGRHILLGEVAEISAAARPPIGAAEIGGAPGIVVMVIGQYGANTLNVSRAVESVLKDFTLLFQPQGIDFYPHLFRPADYIERSVKNLTGHLIFGGLLVIVVLLIFLRDSRIALIPSLAIPLSILAATTVLLSFKVKLNIMVIGGLAIALGEVVDDAIIDTENIFRRLRENAQRPQPLPPWRVVFNASMEVRGSVTFATLIVAIVFIPLLTLGGLAGRLFAPLGSAYIVAILASLLTALTVTPAMCLLLIQQKTGSGGRTPPLIEFLQCRYRHLLASVNRRPLVWVATPLAVSIGLLSLIPRLGGEFLPTLREGHYMVHTANLAGTSLEESIRQGSRLVEQFLKIEGVESASQWAGRAERGADTYGSHYSEYEVRLKEQSGQQQAQVLAKMRAILGQFPGLTFEANTFLSERIEETLSGFTAPVVVNVFGNDLDRLDRVANELVTLIRSIEGATEVQVRSPSQTPTLDIRMDLSSLTGAGIRPLELARLIQTAIRGQVVGTYYLQNRAYETSVILPATDRQDFIALEKLPIKTSQGTFVELAELAELTPTSGRYNILHRGGQRVQSVTTHVVGRDLDSFFQELRLRTLKEIPFPEGITPQFTGAAVAQAEARERLFAHALLAGTGVITLLGVAIGTTRNVLLTVLNLPASLAGGILSALLTGASLSVGSMVGFITLFGITIRNAIMLVSHYRHLTEKEGCQWGWETALRGAVERLPSILMTALVTTLALVPIALDSDNAGREIMGPMATVIIGGLITSTFFSLFVLPVLLARFGCFTDQASAPVIGPSRAPLRIGASFMRLRACFSKMLKPGHH